MKDCMLDLETLARSPDTVIVQIGVCAFNLRTGESDMGIEANIDIQKSLDMGFQVDGGTIEWWFGQSKEAVESILKMPRYSPEKACLVVQQYLKRFKIDRIWSHATFDAPILLHHFRRVGLQFPVHYRGFRDIRTLVSLAGFQKSDWTRFFGQKEGVAHTALADCKTQIKYCVEAYARIQR